MILRDMSCLGGPCRSGRYGIITSNCRGIKVGTVQNKNWEGGRGISGLALVVISRSGRRFIPPLITIGQCTLALDIMP